MTTDAVPLCDVAELFRRSWDGYRVKVWRILGIGALGAAGGLLAGMGPLVAAACFWAVSGRFSLLAWVLAALVSILLVLSVGSWAQLATMECALDETGALDIPAAYRAAWDKIGPFSWVCILFLVLVFGGVFLFLLPGVVVGVFLALSPYACVAEGAQGFGALERSWACVRGRWWSVALRLALIGAVTTLASSIPWIGFILSGFAAPYALILSAELYRDAARTAAPQPPSAAAPRWAFAACALGLFVALAAASRGAVALYRAVPALEARGRSLLEHPLDAQAAQQAAEVLQGGLSPENIGRAADLVLAAQAPQAPGSAQAGLSVSTTAASALPQSPSSAGAAAP